jgi:Fur family ferric uptake transcriptional regulator
MGIKNFKLTNQRAVILDYLHDNHSHPTVEEIYTNVKKKLPRISKKTVYSNLMFLCLEGVIKEVMVKGVKRYEPAARPHHHLICRKCGKVIDVESDELYSHAMDVGKNIKDFDVELANVNFYGICRQCKGGK